MIKTDTQQVSIGLNITPDNLSRFLGYIAQVFIN